MQKFKFFVFCILLTIFISCNRITENESAFFHADARHTGYYKTNGVPQLHGIKWQYKTNGRVFSSPVISENKVFIGSDDSSLYALKADKGSLLWKFKTGGRVSSSVAINDNRLFFVSFDGYLYCLDQNSGNELWKFRGNGEKVFAAKGIHGLPEKNELLEDPWDMFLSSPVIAEGKVYFGSGSGEFYAVDCLSGEKVWEYKTEGVIHSSPAYSDSTVFFGSWDSYLYALNATNGKLRWRFKTGTDTINYNQVGFQSSPVVYKGVVYTGCRDANIWAVDEKTGNLKWKYFNNGSWVIATPAIHEDTLYFTTSDTHKFIALNTSDGKELYTGDCKTFGFSSPAITDGIVYMGNFGGSLMALKSGNGEIIWEFKTDAAKLNSDSLLTVNGNFDFPKVFRENTYQGMQKSVYILYSLGSILSSPVVAGSIVYFGSTDGMIYAIN